MLTLTQGNQGTQVIQGTRNDWSIELLRGVAALIVVLAHYLPLTGLDAGLLGFAYTGVDLFFVLSGFVFAPYLFGRPLDFWAHLVRRFFRLYPLYALALAVYALLRWQPEVSAAYLVKHALFLHTLESREIAFHFNPAFWSLPPEVEFYLVLPLLAGLAGGVRRVMALAALALLVHFATVWAGSAARPGDFLSVLGVHLPGVWIEFMLGALAWWFVRCSPATTTRIALAAAGLALWGGLAWIFMSIGDAGVERSALLRGNMGLLAACAYMLIVAAWVGWVGRPAGWLVATAGVLGNLSYGTYLFHNAAPLVLGRWQPAVPGPLFALLCLGLTLAAAWLMHGMVEAPCRRFGRGLAQRLGAAAR